MIRKKVAIITMHKVINFGSALQAWALQESVCKLGYQVTLIDYLFPNQYYFDNVPKPIKQKRILSLRRITFNKILNIIKKRYFYKSKEQSKLFEEFWNEHFKLTKQYSSFEDLKKYPPESDIYITGSDQVWNPKSMFGDPAFFLSFGRKEIPRISYSASFGVNTIPDNFRAKYSEYLAQYNFLSVRENTGVDLIQETIGKEASVVCDPTLLLTKEDYEILSQESKIKIEKPYLLAYILNYAYNPHPTIDRLISHISKEMGLHVVYLLCGSLEGFKVGSSTISNAGPNEFVHLFRNAKFVVTSSFHGTAFSLIHGIPFYSVLPENKTDSRILSLLTNVGLEERGIRVNTNLDNFNYQYNVNYSKVNVALDGLRKRSQNFLVHSLKNQ